MTQSIFNQEGQDPLQNARAMMAQWMNSWGIVQQLLDECVQLRERVATLESENAALTETVEQWTCHSSKTAESVQLALAQELHPLQNPVLSLSRDIDVHHRFASWHDARPV